MSNHIKGTIYPFIMASSNVVAVLVKLMSLLQIHYSTSKEIIMLYSALWDTNAIYAHVISFTLVVVSKNP